MKNILKIAVLFLLCQSFQCSKTDDVPTTIVPIAEILAQKKVKIQNYINSFLCSASAGCSFIALGVKPCGGPWEYLVYSNNVNDTQLQQMVSEYNALNTEFNTVTGAGSDCMFVSPPAKIGCVNGSCAIIN